MPSTDKKKTTGATPATDSTKAVFQAVCFSLEGNIYAIDVTVVEEIIRPGEIRSADGLPPFAKGMITWCEQSIPLWDLRVRLGYPAAESDDESRVVVVSFKGRVFGMLVDSVTEVLRMEGTHFRNTSKANAACGEDMWRRIHQEDNKQVRLLDHACLFNI